MPIFSDEMVMRYVDGELDDEASAHLEAAMADDADLSRRVDMFAATRTAAREALQPMLAEPVPPALRHAVEAMAERARWTPPQAAPLAGRVLRPAHDLGRLAAAASVAAVLGAAAGYFARGEPAQPGLQVTDVDRAELSLALRSVPTGSERQIGETKFKAIASFADPQQALCREFELHGGDAVTVSVACHDGVDWRARLVVSAPVVEGYAPASASETLDAFLTAIGAGQPLGTEEEEKALANLSRGTE